MHRLRALLLCTPLLAAGCTTVSTVRTSDQTGRGAVFITQSDFHDPYESLGPIQITRRGSTLVGGLVDFAGLSLEPAFEDLLLEARRSGADGVINVRYHQVQHGIPTRILFGILFFVPLPGEVTVTGELIRLPRAGGAR